MPYLVGYATPQDYGAAGDGSTDDTAAIQAALTAAAPTGAPVYLPPGTYRTSSALAAPSNATLFGGASVNAAYSGDVAAMIKPLPGFAGAAVITMSDVGSTQTPGCTLRGFGIDGSALTTGTTHGLYASGPVYLTRITDVWISGMPGWGIMTAQDAGVASGASWPYWWWVRDTMIQNCGGGGVSLTSMTDSTWSNVYAIGCGKGSAPGPGWYIDWAGNTQLVNCRGEWSGTNGFHLTGAWWTGTGSGGMTMTGCSTDRNEQHGTLIDATGNGPVLISNLMSRRDGRNGGAGGGSYAGLSIAGATVPVVVSTVSVYPGVDDTGSGTNSPQIGVSLTGSSIATSIGAGYVQAATTALVNTASGGFTYLGPGLVAATGTPASPTGYAGGTATGIFALSASSTTVEGGNLLSQDSIDIYTAGQGLKVAEGSNAKQGTATLSAGSVTVSNTAVTANSRIFLTIQSPGGTVGAPYVSARTAGTSFTIKSTSSADTSVVAYEIFEQG